MVRASYRQGTTGVMVLIATKSSERCTLNMYRGVLSIGEKAHESSNGARVCGGRVKSRTSLSSTFTAAMGASSRPTRVIQFNAVCRKRSEASVTPVNLTAEGCDCLEIDKLSALQLLDRSDIMRIQQTLYRL